MTTNDNEKLAKTSSIFKCEICNYTTIKKFNLRLHFETKKHKNYLLTSKNNETLAKTSKKFICLNCDKGFNDRAGLWRHKKKCTLDETSETNYETENIKIPDEISDKELIIMLIKQNTELAKETSEFKNMIMKVLENGTHNTNNM
jgi:hypothetical protein